MPLKIAETSFATGPDNKAVTVDVYGTPPLKPTNNQPAVTNSKATSLFDKATNNTQLGILKGISKQYAQTGKLVLDKDKLIKSIGNTFGVKDGNVKTISGKLMDNVLKSSGFYGTGIGSVVDGISKSVTGNSFQKSLLGGFSDVSLVVKNVKQTIKKVKDFDYDNLTELSKAIGSISGDNDFIRLLNLTEAAGIIQGLNSIAADFYIPGVADKLMASLSDEDRKITTGLFSSGLTSITDISTIDTLINNLSPSEILNTNPNILTLIVSGYTGGNTYTTPSKEAADALLTRLETIKPTWDLTDGTTSSDLNLFKSFSSFAKDSFIIAGYNKSELAIASSYSARPFATSAKEIYPTIGLASAT